MWTFKQCSLYCQETKRNVLSWSLIWDTYLKERFKFYLQCFMNTTPDHFNISVSLKILVSTCTKNTTDRISDLKQKWGKLLQFYEMFS